MKNILRKSLISFFSVWITGMVLLFVIVLSSCSTTKKVEKTKSDIALKSELDSKNKVDETSNVKTAASGETASSKNTESTENKSKEKETKTTKYDTSQPIIPGTGKPPVAEESTTTERETSNKDTKVLEALTTKYNLQVQENKRLKQINNSWSKYAARNVSNTVKTETPSNWWIWLLVGICIPVAIGLLVKFGAFSKLFVFVLKIFKVKS